MKDSVDGIGYRFRDTGLLQEALTHRSVGTANNERLEFLGDSVLNTIISSRLFEQYPGAPEGDLSRMRARLVRGSTIGAMAGITAILVHSISDFNLCIPANAVLFTVLAALAAGPVPLENVSRIRAYSAMKKPGLISLQPTAVYHTE